MDMPEGLKIAYEVDTSTDGGKERINFALNLMKEMAETLYRIRNCVVNGSSCELTYSSIDDAHSQIKTWIDQPLNKYIDWK